MPLPMVLATAVPNTKAAMKFQKAAHSTARNGVSTRVETTVAMELAASCQPFENSKAKVRKIVMTTSANWLTESGVLQDDAFNHVGNVFTFVHCGFHHFENLFPLDDLHRVFFFFEQLGDQRATKPVAFVLQSVDFDDVLKRFIGRPHGVNGAGKFRGGGGKNLGKLQGAGSHVVDAIKNEAAGGGVNQVDDVIHGAAKLVHILAIERCNEGLVKLAENLVGNLVALVLNGLYTLHLLRHTCVMLQHRGERVGPANDIFRLFAEQGRKITVLRKESLQKSGHVLGSPLRSQRCGARSVAK